MRYLVDRCHCGAVQARINSSPDMRRAFPKWEEVDSPLEMEDCRCGEVIAALSKRVEELEEEVAGKWICEECNLVSYPEPLTSSVICRKCGKTALMPHETYKRRKLDKKIAALRNRVEELEEKLLSVASLVIGEWNKAKGEEM